MKKALITGITGQDGSYLAELLIEKGYEVHGLVRRTSNINRDRIDMLRESCNFDQTRLRLHYGDLADSPSLIELLRKVQPDEIYNLAAQSHVGISFQVPEYTIDITGLGAGRLLDAVRLTGLHSTTKFYQASSSEMFGKVQQVPQTERTPFWPLSPYACAKTIAHYLTVNYREAYGMHASCGILFNHESPRRGENFLTRKVTMAVGRIKCGFQRDLHLGNLEAKRDWGYAKEYVDAMWKIMQQDAPDDYVISTGETHSVLEFVDAAFSHAGLNWQDYVVHDSKYDRPSDVAALVGDSSKAREKLGWSPKIRMDGLAKLMVDHDLQLATIKKATTS